MVNQKDHKIISSICSKDIGDVSNWLKKFPNLKTITKDGSLIYKNAIEMLNTLWIQSYNSERKNGKYPPLKDIFVDYNNDNKLIIVIAAGENDDDTN